MARLPTRRTIFDLAGEGQVNADGSRRQDELRRCRPGQMVTLRREPANKFDANAVLVVSMRGTGIGYLARDDAKELAAALDERRPHAAQIHELTGGMPDYPNIGCRISIVWDGRPLPPSRAIGDEQTLIGGSPMDAIGGGIPKIIWIPALALLAMYLISLL